MREKQILKKIEKDRNFRGIKFLIASGLAFSLMSVCVKSINGRIPVSELVFARASISLVITRLVLFKNNINPWGNQKKLLIIRGLLGTLALFCIFKALTILPIATATVIQYIYPTFTVICAHFILKEDILKRIVYSIIIGWIGIILVSQPEFISNRNVIDTFIALTIAIIGALLTSLAYICVRKLSAKEHPLVIIHYFPLVSIPLSLPLIINNFVLPIGFEWIWILGIGFFTQIGQVCITEGLRLIPAGQATSLNYSQVIFSSIWGLLIFKDTISTSVYLGGLCVLISTIISISASKSSKA
ncbi:DMT family transporter [Prochlorococcus marinus]|uniref:EamA family transporter n=1 Tax=Prochlorococcus marinus XMU1408 TaxID=2213228 RepID=A0A318R4G1_PROMR|nr:DMT family transporter [Prochlorococcus marinus]MBW3041899.1 EamA family transporter [Prochlorococcus marinus str. XMU1408]PYE03030.1 EamA family transporter [Prochlorococcus marinus XMU1408]